MFVCTELIRVRERERESVSVCVLCELISVLGKAVGVFVSSESVYCCVTAK